VLLAAGVASGPINSIAEGVEFAAKLGLDPVVEVGEGDAMVPSVRNPITFSASSIRYDLPPPTLGEHSDEVRAWIDGSDA